MVMFVGKVEGEEGEEGAIDAWQFGGVGVSSPRRASGSRECFFGLPLGFLWAVLFIWVSSYWRVKGHSLG